MSVVDPILVGMGRRYSPHTVLADLGVSVTRTWLRDTWAAWSARRQTIVIATNLSAVQERCILAHEVEHVLADDIGCANAALAAQQERNADLAAARKLVAISDLAEVAPWTVSERQAARELQVTERMLRIRLQDLDGEGWPWPDTSKIAG